MTKEFILKLIRFYQRIKIKRKSIYPPNNNQISICRFYPTCSQYAYEAIERYGIVKGVLLGIKRIAKCHPWSEGGTDPVPDHL